MSYSGLCVGGPFRGKSYECRAPILNLAEKPEESFLHPGELILEEISYTKHTYFHEAFFSGINFWRHESIKNRYELLNELAICYVNYHKF
mgnify:CR=1 FL=1